MHFFEISYVLFVTGQTHIIVTLYYFSSFTLLSSVTFFLVLFLFLVLVYALHFDHFLSLPPFSGLFFSIHLLSVSFFFSLPSLF